MLKGNIVFPLLSVFFLSLLLIFSIIATNQRRSIFSEAKDFTPIVTLTNSQNPPAFCRDGTPEGSCCKSGYRCVDADGVYLCIGASCGLANSRPQ